METTSLNSIRSGREKVAPPSRTLRAGPLLVDLLGADLRYVRSGELEVLRRLHPTVRDHNWNTLEPEVVDFEVEDGGDSFRAGFEAIHRQGEVDFSWRGEITGADDGTISYAMRGMAHVDFAYNRIGFCVLHPPGYAGCRYRAQTPDGEIEGTLPETIGPQRYDGSEYYALFAAFHGLAVELPGGVAVDHAFSCDLFEMEDQRNWTDASFKSYCTPLALGFPHMARAGQAVEQTVTLKVSGAAPAAPAPSEIAPVSLQVGGPSGFSLPPLGLGHAAEEGPELSPRAAELLRALAPAHLRVELRSGDADAAATLAAVLGLAGSLDTKLELALFVGTDGEDGLAAVAEALAGSGRVARVLAFREGATSAGFDAVTPAGLVERVREALGDALPGVPIGGGTNIYFTELNRTRPDVSDWDAVAYSLNPQVHAGDDLSFVEALEPQGETVRSAKAFAAGKPIAVGPVTLLPRFNPFATTAEPPPPPGELPTNVDPRQSSLLGAAWTVGSIKYLAEAGAGSVTYYETVGWRGVLEREAGSRLPERFRSEPEEPFPPYHVLREVSAGGELREAISSEPLALVGLAFERDGELHLLATNLTPDRLAATIGPLPEQLQMRRLNEVTIADVAADPASFAAGGEAVEAADGTLELELLPFETVAVRA